MGWQAAADKFGIAGTVLEAKSDGKSATLQNKLATGQYGDVVAIKAFGPGSTENVDYEVILAGTIAAALGIINADGIMLNSIAIGTSAGGAPTVKGAGEFIKTGAVTDPTYVLSGLAITPLHHSQIMASAFTWVGVDVEIKDCSYTAKCTISRGTVEGNTRGFGIGGGIEEVSASFDGFGIAAPVITAGEGWTITTPVGETNPDSDYTKYTVTLQRKLDATRPVAGA